MIGLIARKEGMSRVFNEEGKSVPVTILKIHSNVVSQIKTSEKDGYDAIQLSYDDLRKKKINMPTSGHFKKSNSQPKKKIVEFKNFRNKELKLLKLGMELKLNDVFRENDFLDVKSISKGKGSFRPA